MILRLHPRTTALDSLWLRTLATAYHPLPATGFILRRPGPILVYEDLMRCHAAWDSSNKIPPDLIAEMVRTWKSTERGQVLQPILDGKREWFMCLDQMSARNNRTHALIQRRRCEDR